jgi:hypothetical protein
MGGMNRQHSQIAAVIADQRPRVDTETWPESVPQALHLMLDELTSAFSRMLSASAPSAFKDELFRRRAEYTELDRFRSRERGVNG